MKIERVKTDVESDTALHRFPVCRVDFVDFHSCFVAVSKEVFIGDIDVTNYEKRWRMIHRVFDIEKELGLRFRVYVTHSGIRFIEVSRLFEFEKHERFINHIFTRTSCDLAYVEMCNDTHTFRARLTPKTGRDEIQVCIPIERSEEFVIKEEKIKSFIAFHDLVTTF
jgi:hypothetical protein